MARNYGFLTERDREYLTGEKDINSLSNPRDKKQDIRKSITAAEQDYQLLARSPYWTDEDFEQVWTPQERNTGIMRQMRGSDVETAVESTIGQSQIYGDAVRGIAEDLQDLDISGDWQDEEGLESAVQEMFVSNIVRVFEDVLAVIGATDEEIVREFFRDVWPDKERALEIVDAELNDS